MKEEADSIRNQLQYEKKYRQEAEKNLIKLKEES